MSFTLPFTIDEANEFDLSWPSALEYIAFMKGPIASTGLSQLTGIVSSIYTTPDDPDLQIFFGGYQAACATTGLVGALMDNGGRHVSISPTNLHPRSRGISYVFLRERGKKKKKDRSVLFLCFSGTLRLASNDPFEKPVIHGNYLSDPMDEAVLLHGIQIALSLSNTTALAKYNMTLSNAPLPACSQHAYPSDDYWRCAIRQDTGPENHQAGSCKMGPATDRMAVVDPRLRVHGIRGLRVADTSIMPRVFLIFLTPTK